MSTHQNANLNEEVARCLSSDILAQYDIYSYRHAACILKHAFPRELDEIENAIRHFRITKSDIGMPGGNESVIPKKISKLMRPQGWNEARVRGDLEIFLSEQSEEEDSDGKLKKHSLPEKAPIRSENYIDGHKIDYVKGRVAFDLEWNSKDQTFDRDLYAFRLFHECNIISVAVLLTRSEKLNPVFERVPKLGNDGSVERDRRGKAKSCKEKYGASTTWMGKLLPRLNAGRHGGCPVLVVGITPDSIEDWLGESREKLPV